MQDCALHWQCTVQLACIKNVNTAWPWNDVRTQSDNCPLTGPQAPSHPSLTLPSTLPFMQTGGHMVGMSRDKCGAASAAGFVATAATLGSPVRITALLGFVRNSIGSDAYVSDEIITSRAGAKVLVVNTDAGEFGTPRTRGAVAGPHYM